MAEELTGQQRRLAQQLAETEQRLKDLADESSELKDGMSDFRRASFELTKGINQLKNPVLSNTVSILQSVAANRKQNEIAQKQIEASKTQIAQIQTAIKQQQAGIDAEYDKVRSINAQIGILEQQQSLAIEQGNAANEEILLLEQRNNLLKSEIANMEGNIPEQEAAAKSKLQAMQSEVAKLKALADAPISNAERGLIEPSIAGMSKEALLRHITSLENAAAEQESQVAELSRQAQIIQESNDTASKIEKLQQEREDWYNQSSGVFNKILDLQKEAKDQLQVANDAYDKGQKIIEDKQKEEKKLTKKLQKQEAELKLQSFKNLADVISKFATALDSLIAPIRKTQQTFGIAAGQALKLNIGNFAESLKSYANVFSGLAPVTAEEIKSAQQAFQAEFGGVITPAAATEIAVNAKQLGVTTSQLAVARRQFMTATMGNVSAAAAQQDKFIDTFKSKGLTAKDALDAIAQNSEIFARNGTRFAVSFARAAADAKKIGVDLGKIDQVGDNIIGDFEGFLTKTAELGAMGFGLDSGRLAEVAETGDTGALFNELRSQLSATGKDITNLRRSEQLALSQAFGIPMAELQRLAQQQTDGSGEQLTEQEKATTFLSKLVNLVEKFSGILAGVAAFISTTLYAATLSTSINTARIAMAQSGGGAGSLFKQMLGFGGKGAPAQTGGATPAAGGAAGGGVSGISKLTSGLNPAALLQGAAALVVMAGALYVMGKALQQFKDVSAGDLGVAVGAITALTLALVALGALMASGIGGAAVLAGIGVMVLMAGAVALVGAALQSVGNSADGIARLGTSFDTLASALGRLNALDFSKLDKIKELANTNLALQPITAPTVPTVPPATPKAPPATGAAPVTPPATPATPVTPVDFAPLEKKLDAVVAAIGRMSVQLDGNKVGRVVANTAASTAQVGVLARSS